MKTRWMNLSSNEQQTVKIGSMALSILLFYFFIWSPLGDSVDSLRIKTETNQQLLTWMISADKQLKNNPEKIDAPQASSLSMLAYLQKSLPDFNLEKNVNSMQETENNTAEIHLQKIAFDKMIHWLISLYKNKALYVERLTVHEANDNKVDATLVLKS